MAPRTLLGVEGDGRVLSISRGGEETGETQGPWETASLVVLLKALPSTPRGGREAGWVEIGPRFSESAAPHRAGNQTPWNVNGPLRKSLFSRISKTKIQFLGRPCYLTSSTSTYTHSIKVREKNMKGLIRRDNVLFTRTPNTCTRAGWLRGRSAPQNDIPCPPLRLRLPWRRAPGLANAGSGYRAPARSHGSRRLSGDFSRSAPIVSQVINYTWFIYLFYGGESRSNFRVPVPLTSW